MRSLFTLGPSRPRPLPPVLGGLLALSVLAQGCRSETPPAPGQLMISVQSDMAIPKDIDSIRVEVLTFGSVQFANTYQVGQGALLIPATLAIVAGEDPSRPVTIRVIALSKQKPRVLREAVTTVPTDRIALLRLPLQWLCDETATQPAPGQYDSTCPKGETCVAGTCVEMTVVSANLPAFLPELVFGGGTGTGDGTCFDTSACFDGATSPEVDLATCSIEAPASGTPNVAISTGAGKSGICEGDVCLVPLDRSDENGWRLAPGGARILLPEATCSRVSSGLATVLLSTSCETKTEQVPTCGSWSSSGLASTIAPKGGAGGAAGSGGSGGSAGEAGASGEAGSGGVAGEGGEGGEGGMAGSGGSAGSPTALALLSWPCGAGVECGEGGLCLLPSGADLDGGGPPGGYCTLDCSGWWAENQDKTAGSFTGPSPCDPGVDPNTPGASPSAVCVAAGASGKAYCMTSCAFGESGSGGADSSKCGGRAGVACFPELGPSGEIARAYCRPQCSSSAQCPEGSVCSPGDGVCVQTAPDLLSGGQPCAVPPPGESSPCLGVCQRLYDPAAHPLKKDVGVCVDPCSYGEACGAGQAGRCERPLFGPADVAGSPAIPPGTSDAAGCDPPTSEGDLGCYWQEGFFAEDVGGASVCRRAKDCSDDGLCPSPSSCVLVPAVCGKKFCLDHTPPDLPPDDPKINCEVQPTVTCNDCTQTVAAGACVASFTACLESQDCSNMVICYQSCGGTQGCYSQCRSAFPAAAQLFDAAAGCVCQSDCLDACADQCSGFLGAPCGQTEAFCGPTSYCDVPDGSNCGGGDAGVCKPRPESGSCSGVGEPTMLCGCDGRAYLCVEEATARGTDVDPSYCPVGGAGG